MNSVTNPPMVHIGSRHYRKNVPKSSSYADYSVPVGALDELPDEIELEMDPALIELESKITIGDPCTLEMKIPPLFQRFVIGPQHSTIRRLEEEFSCQIRLPSASSLSDMATIKASSKFNIINVCRRIFWIMTDARSHCPPTHFINLPVTLPCVAESFLNFQQKVLESASTDRVQHFSGVDKQIFHSPSTLHFTLVTLVLADADEVSMACEILKSFVESDESKRLLAKGPLCLTLKGLEYMNDDPSAVDVLYAKIVDCPDAERLQTIADNLSALFSKHNLTSSGPYRPDASVKLHMTILNSRFRLERNQKALQAARRTSFSVVGILKEFGNYCFADKQLFDQLHLSDRMNMDQSTGFYKCCCQVKLQADQSNFAQVRIL